MNRSPKISIIMPTYNCAQYIRSAVESVLKQTYQDYELMIVDDGSEDETASTVSPYLGPKVHYIRLEHQGIAHARNHALRESSAPFIAFLDADDVWVSDKLAKQMTVFQNPEVDICYTGHTLIDHEDRVTRTPAFKAYRGKVTKQIFYDNFMPASSVMLKRECLAKSGGFDETLTRSEDWDLWLRLSVFCFIDYAAEPLLFYRKGRPYQLTENLEKLREAQRQVIQQFVQTHPTLLSDQEIRAVQSKICFEAGYAMADKDPLKSLRYYFDALKFQPSDYRLYKGIIRTLLHYFRRPGR